MKTKIFLSIILTLSSVLCALSQIPQGFNYQAIARDASGNPIVNTAMPVRITIQSEQTGGTIFWQELHSSVTTNDFGMLTLVVGQGTREAGTAATFADIDWSVTPKYIKTEIDYNGWKEMGVSPLWSVPYAQVAKSSEQWTSSGNNIYRLTGNVGIGTTTPQTILHLKGNAGILNLEGSDHSYIQWYPDGFAAGRKAYVGFPGTSSTYFEIKNEIVGDIILSGSKIGIGTITPAYKLDVNGEVATRTANGFRLRNTSYSTLLRNDDNNFWLLLTDKNNPDGNYNSLRPFRIEFSTGNVFLGNGALTVFHGGNVGIGTTTPSSRLVIQPPATWDDNVPLFEVKNKIGVPILAVYNNGVKILVEDTDGKGVKGGFAIGGFDPTKGAGDETVNLMTVSPDSIRLFIDNSAAKGVKGGFAIGSFDDSKAINTKAFMNVTPQASKTGQYNTFLGFQAGLQTSTVYSVFIGRKAGFSHQKGSSNVFIGDSCAALSTTGSENIAIGKQALLRNNSYQNVAIGNKAGALNETGHNNTFIGYMAGYSNRGDYNVFIGHEAGYNETGDNKLYIANNRTVNPLIYGDFYPISPMVVISGNASHNINNRRFFVNGTAGGTSGWYNDSDIRLKTSIADIPYALERVLKMHGIEFEWKEKENREKGKQIGFVGQELINVLPEVVDNSNDHYSVQYGPITAILVEAIKEQQKIIESQKEELELLKERLSAIEAMMGKK